MAKACRHCFVSGKVQGVFYRQNTKQQATKLNLTGWVKNLPDGRVELLACGEEQDLATLLAWLPEGPPRANVTEVQVNEQPFADHKYFEILG